MDKRISADYGDVVSVEQDHADITLRITEAGDEELHAYLTPKQARKVAKALIKAADRVEGKNA